MTAVDPWAHPCPRCRHPLRWHTVHLPRTLYCPDCDCTVKAKWQFAPFVMLLGLADRLKAWGDS